jgi:integrase/recombinase XerD
VLKDAAKKVGLEKRVHLHLFRHSRATMYAQHLTEAQMEENFGWVHGSKMSGTYVHLSGKQIDDAILRIYGMKPKEDITPELRNIVCPRCKKDNGPAARFCTQCGQPLELQALQEIQEKKGKLPDLLSLIMSSEEGRKLFFEIQKDMSEK